MRHITGVCPFSNPQPKQNVWPREHVTVGTHVRRHEDPIGAVMQCTVSVHEGAGQKRKDGEADTYDWHNSVSHLYNNRPYQPSQFKNINSTLHTSRTLVLPRLI